jgi:hypothetical protein
MVKNDHTARLTEYNDYYITFGKGEVQFKIETNVLELNVGHNFKSINFEGNKNPLILTGSTEK